jgi:hypothetical protein
MCHLHYARFRKGNLYLGMFGSNWTATLDMLHMLVGVEFDCNVLLDAGVGPFLAILCKEVMLDFVFSFINNETLDKLLINS